MKNDAVSCVEMYELIPHRHIVTKSLCDTATLWYEFASVHVSIHAHNKINACAKT